MLPSRKFSLFQVEAKPVAQIVWKQGLREIGQEVGTFSSSGLWWILLFGGIFLWPDGNVIKVGKVMTLIGGTQSELVLENVKREDLGAFTCLAKNSLGEASALLILPGDFLCTSSSSVCTWGNATFLWQLAYGTFLQIQRKCCRRPMVQFTSQLLARREAVRPPWD